MFEHLTACRQIKTRTHQQGDPTEPINRYTLLSETLDRLKKHLKRVPWLAKAFVTRPLKYFTCHSRCQSWSRGSAITMPKMETSKNIIQVGNDCFLFILLSFTASSPTELITRSNMGVEFSWDGSGDTCSAISFSESCCWLNLSMYSGNNFLNVGLLRWESVRFRLNWKLQNLKNVDILTSKNVREGTKPTSFHPFYCINSVLVSSKQLLQSKAN